MKKQPDPRDWYMHVQRILALLRWTDVSGNHWIKSRCMKYLERFHKGDRQPKMYRAVQKRYDKYVRQRK